MIPRRRTVKKIWPVLILVLVVSFIVPAALNAQDEGTPAISLNRTHLYFAAVRLDGAFTGGQTIIVNNSGDSDSVLHWRATKYSVNPADQLTWLHLTNITGTQSDSTTIWIDPYNIPEGTYIATIRFESDDASNSPQEVDITFFVYPKRTDSKPFGYFDSPVNGSTVMSSIPVTGWALDDIEVEEVTIWRDPVLSHERGIQFVGDADLVDGARLDVETSYPTSPFNYRGGWGYMMLTNGLPNGGNGTYTIHAYAKDGYGHEVLLGSKTIYCDNASAVKPFGAIDTPSQGGKATGDEYRNQGWVLTPMPNYIPTDGSTLACYIDGDYVGQPTYNIYRKDVAGLFPGYANSDGAMAYLDFDSSVYASGVHTIQWTATDSAGNTDGIGSRFFYTIQNDGFPNIEFPPSQLNTHSSGKQWHSIADIRSLPLNRSMPRMRTGYTKTQPHDAQISRRGAARFTVKQDRRLVLTPGDKNQKLLAGYILAGDRVLPLPVGSTLKHDKGEFYWQISPVFFGSYRLVFILEDPSGFTSKQPVMVNVVSKY